MGKTESVRQSPAEAADPPAASDASSASISTVVGKVVYQSRLDDTQRISVAENYQALERQRILSEWKDSPAQAQAYLSDPERFRFIDTDFHQIATIDEKNQLIVWVFQRPPDGQRWPSRAWRILDRTTDRQYDVERVGYCDDKHEDCLAWLAQARAPMPRTKPDTNSYGQWQMYVYKEPCRPGPAYRPSKAPLQHALARSDVTEANVEFLMLINPCGEVRDVFFEVSSGNRDIDLAALRWVLRANFTDKLTSTPGVGLFGKLPFSFSIEP